MKYDTLGSRMKGYEDVTNTKLVNRLPVIIRLDGRAFHTFTKGFTKPFDFDFNNCMHYTMKRLCENIPNCVFGYTQSDEITLVLLNKEENEPWFDNRVQKIVSVSASMATLYFNEAFNEYLNAYKEFAYGEQATGEDQRDYEFRERKRWTATFDARVFNIPKEEVLNNIIWRQNDATKNSINSVAQAYFSHKELQGKGGSDMQDMLMLQKGINWNDTPTIYKRGCACIRQKREIETPNGIAIRNKWVIDTEMPIITQNKEYIEKLLNEID